MDWTGMEGRLRLRSFQESFAVRLRNGAVEATPRHPTLFSCDLTPGWIPRYGRKSNPNPARPHLSSPGLGKHKMYWIG